MHVVATAGHVDHGKSTLVRALTGMEPDRWAEEHRRGLTIDLGFAWTTLASGREVAFVDVPGHERFLGNMLAGLGPAPVVCFLVAADEGWMPQSSDHRDAVAALGIEHGVIVVSRSDRAPGRVTEVTAQARAELAATGLQGAPAIAVSAVSGAGYNELRAVLDRVLDGAPSGEPHGRVRLWLDRSFTITGAGTVVTGTLGAGVIAPGDRLQLIGRDGARDVVVRGVQSRGRDRTVLAPVDRAALNLRGVAAGEVRRGDVLVTPGAWLPTSAVDVRRTTGAPYTEVPREVSVHAGTATVPAWLRPFGADHARLTLRRPLPLIAGDRLVVRLPAIGQSFGGAVVLDAEPPALSRRGDAARRDAVLSATGPRGDLRTEVVRRGAVTPAHLLRLGLVDGTDATPPDGVHVVGRWWVEDAVFARWRDQLGRRVDELHRHDPLTAGLSEGAAVDALALPDPALIGPVAAAAGLDRGAGHLRRARRGNDLGPAEGAVAQVLARLADAPFRAPEADELTAAGLGSRELAAAARSGRILRLTGGIVLAPDAPGRARAVLAGLPQPFTTSQARQSLDTTRRVAIPLLEHLDALGWTRRIDAGHREVLDRP